MIPSVVVNLVRYVPEHTTTPFSCKGCDLSEVRQCKHPLMPTKHPIGCTSHGVVFKAVPIEAKLPPGYTADELDRDNPYNQWMRDASPEQAVPARSTDPTTSKGKPKVNKYEQAVLDILKGLYEGQGYTGKQIASLTGHPLNCITPRFAPLRRKGLIKDNGIKRDKQIVWVLA